VYPRGFWQAVGSPGLLWLIIFFVIPFYAVVAAAFGGLDPVFLSIDPYWNPLHWNTYYLTDTIKELPPGGLLWPAVVHTFVYVGFAVGICLLIGYPVAYFVARHAGRWKPLFLVGLILPFFISYLMRMLAWLDLLADEGLVNRVLLDLHVISEPERWLAGRPSSVVMALVYGWIPFMILPLVASLDRIDRSLLESARDLGASPFWAFVKVTLPLSVPGILAGCVLITLPMFGDYYTNDMISRSPKTTMIGNQINLYMFEGYEKQRGAALVLVLAAFLSILMAYYLYSTMKASREARG
jgi:ABC-type spermidine/putrescine transport system permease subunit I